MIISDDVADADPATGHEHPVHLVDDLALVGGQVDDAVADDDIHRGVRQRYVLDDSFRNSTLDAPALAALPRASSSISSVMSTP